MAHICLYCISVIYLIALRILLIGYFTYDNTNKTAASKAIQDGSLSLNFNFGVRTYRKNKPWQSGSALCSLGWRTMADQEQRAKK